MNSALQSYLSLFMIGLLLIPVMAIDYVNEDEITIIENRLNYNFCDVGIVETNIPEWESHYNNVNVISEDVNTDCINVDLVTAQNINVEYHNNINYVGNDTYLVNTWEFAQNYDYIAIELNLTTHNLTNCDVLLLNSEFVYDSSLDTNSAFYIGYFTGSGTNHDYLNDLYLNENERLFYIDIGDKVSLLSAPDTNIYLEIWRGNLALPYDENITFQIQKAQISNQSAFTISDTTYYLIIVSSVSVLNIMMIIFSSETIDLYIDRKNKWRK